MKLSKDDLIKKINEKVLDEDVKIELMEDVTDSIENETDTSEEDSSEDEQETRTVEKTLTIYVGDETGDDRYVFLKVSE